MKIYYQSNSSQKKFISILIILLIIITIFPTVNSENYKNITSIHLNPPNDDKELHLLRSEHYLYLKAINDTKDFNLKYVFPPDYQYQVPILLEILNDSTANILDYKIEDDKNKPNKIINFSIGEIKKEEIVLIHFLCWVLVKNDEYNNLPEYVKFPKIDELPDQTKIWLSSSEVVQSKSIIIKYKADQIKGSNNNLIEFANQLAHFIKENKYLLFIIQLNLGIFFSQDAITTLLINGENIGRSHLGCALFRANNIPSRVLLASNDQTFWTQMHYMLEYYCPNYGWILVDPTRGKTPYEPRRQIINRVCFPEDENNTKADYIIPLMKGEERWIWIENDNVKPYYIDCQEGSKSKMFIENMIQTNSFTAEYTFLLTQIVFHLYEQFMREKLTDENLEYFQNGIKNQKKAINEFINSIDLINYIYYMEKAFDNFKNINLLYSQP
jgi:hypothetical protein